MASSGRGCEYYLKRTETLLVPPGLTLARALFLPCFGWMKTTWCAPGFTLMPERGVTPSGRPSSTTLLGGVELRFNLPGSPLTAAAAGVDAARDASAVEV